VYRRLAAAAWRSPWRVLGTDPAVPELADLVVDPTPDPAPHPRSRGVAG
ncbi:MAG: dTMP kinase, partial [Dietzia sp.]|nr:dTMP kinase [Dietzia sp.]